MQLRTVFVTGMLVTGLATALIAPTVAQDAQDAAPITQFETAPSAEGVELTPVLAGYTRPIQVTNAGDGSGRLFVVEQVGSIWVVEADGTQASTPFLNISDRISPEATRANDYTERGLLGLAFDPDYASNGFFYVNYTNVGGDTVIARYGVTDDANIADPASEVVLLTQEQPYANHNGGSLAFGADGYLYISLGDGGSAGDPEDRAQNTNTLLGKILRIDPQDDGSYLIPEDNPFADGQGGLPEVWALGLRNVWRMSFDRVTGDMYLGDVGQNAREEINFLPASTESGAPEGGANFGWNALEADVRYDTNTPVPPDAVAPIVTYQRNVGISVTGGYVYRGEALPQLDGAYFYGDWGYGTIWTAYRDAAGAWQSEVFFSGLGIQVSSFGEDEAGELYVADYSGRVFQFTASNSVTGNG